MHLSRTLPPVAAGAAAAAVLLRFCILSLGSLLIGVGVSLCCALLLKRFQQTAAADGDSSSGGGGGPPSYDAPSYEIALIVCGSYMAYLVAEVRRHPAGGGGGVRIAWQRRMPPPHPHHHPAWSLPPPPPVTPHTPHPHAMPAAQVMGMSGIVSLLFSAICHSHYTIYSASHNAQVCCGGGGYDGWVGGQSLLLQLSCRGCTFLHLAAAGVYTPHRR